MLSRSFFVNHPKNGSGVVFNDIEDQPSDVLSGTSITFKENNCEGSDRRILPKVKQKNYASEDGAVQYYSENYYLGNKCTKDEEWFTY